MMASVVDWDFILCEVIPGKECRSSWIESKVWRYETSLTYILLFFLIKVAELPKVVEGAVVEVVVVVIVAAEGKTVKQKDK